jgi:hypothetical protein
MTKRDSSGLKRKSTSLAPARASRWTLFGHAPLLEGEDAAAYDQLLKQIWSAVKPLDSIEEMLTVDFVSLQWEVWRWRRLKSSLMQGRTCKALEGFLVEQLESNYALHQEHFENYLTEILQISLPKDQVACAKTLAAECAPNDAEAGDTLDKVLRSIGMDTGTVLDEARAQKTRELVQEYVQREPDAVALVQELLSSAGMSIDTLTVDALDEKFDYIERIDRLTTIAEGRRNASLHEIERHRVALGPALRSKLQEIEDAEFKEIDPPLPKGKNAA